MSRNKYKPRIKVFTDIFKYSSLQGHAFNQGFHYSGILCLERHTQIKKVRHVNS